MEQANGFSPVCILACVFKPPLWLNAMWHLDQANGFPPIWILACCIKSPLWLNALSHFEQENGLFPVWILSCIFKSPLWLNSCSRQMASTPINYVPLLLDMLAIKLPKFFLIDFWQIWFLETLQASQFAHVEHCHAHACTIFCCVIVLFQRKKVLPSSAWKKFLWFALFVINFILCLLLNETRQAQKLSGSDLHKQK